MNEEIWLLVSIRHAKPVKTGKDAPDNCVMGGLPAKVIKQIENVVEEVQNERK